MHGAFLVLAAASLWAGGGTIGSTAAGFLRLGVGPRAIAMGETFTGLADDVSALAYNPAGLARLRRQELALMHSEVFDDVRQEWFGYAYPSQTWGTLAVSLNVLHIRVVPVYDINDTLVGETSSQDLAYSLAYARSFGRLAVGVSGKYIRSRLTDFTAAAVAGDAGLLWDTPLRGLKAGVSVQNIGTTMYYRDLYSELPVAGRAGLSYRLVAFNEGRGREQEVTAAADMVVYRDRDAFPSFGLEYVRHNVLALRLGWKGGYGSGHGLTMGAGFIINRSRKARLPEASFDYAFIDFGDLNHSHRASITLKFGAQRWAQDLEAPVELRQAPRAKPAAPEARPVPKVDRRAPEPGEGKVLWVDP